MEQYEMINLYKALFVGRPDVFAEKWDDPAGAAKKGYAPVKKQQGNGHTPLTDNDLYQHLAGHVCLGTYPLFPDGTSKFIAADFDNHNGERDPFADVQAFTHVLNDRNIPFLIERSQSGMGCHVWIIFQSPVLAWKSRAVINALLKEAKSSKEDGSLASYDKLFPAQDSLQEYGKHLGNLIALPLQGKCLKEDNTVFLDPTNEWEPYPDQWAYLQTVQKVSEEQFDILIEELCLKKDVGNANSYLPDIDLEISAELPGRVQKLIEGNERLKSTWEGNRPDLNDQSRSGYDMALANGLASLGCNGNEIATALVHNPSGKGNDATAAYVELTAKKALAQRSDPRILRLISLRELLSEPDVITDWVVDELLPVDGLSLFAAKPKTGKSTLIRQLALAVARGEDFLGRKTKQGGVIYLALEERRADVRSHFRQMGATEEDTNLKIFAGMAPEEGTRKVRTTLEVERPLLIIVDTMARLARIGDLNDYSQVIRGLEPFLAMAREVGTHVCLLHHSKKGDSKGLDTVLGSTGLAGSVDTIVLMGRTEKFRTIQSIQRVGEEMPETVIEFDPDTRTSSLAGSREEVEIETMKGAIFSFLDGQDIPVRENLINEEVEGTKGYKVKALRALVKEGRVIRSGKGRCGNPYLYQISGSLVPSLYTKPENQTQIEPVTDENQEGNSGSEEQGNLTTTDKNQK